MGSLNRIILWDHDRGSWQYDVLCLLIIAFIFLSPKAWFERKEKLATQISRVIVQARDVSTEREDLERQVREMSGNPLAQISSLHEFVDTSGERYYEIEIR